MKIVVGIKHVPDTETKVRIAADGVSLDEAAVTKWIISPYDEYALEQALRIREGRGDGEVIAVSLGREAAQASLRQALATGADRAVLVRDDRLERTDGLLRARALAEVVRREGAELVLLGKYGVGTDEGQTGPMLAELLGWPHAVGVTRLDLAADGGFELEREIEGGVEVQSGTLPAVFGCEKGLNEPRYPSLKGIMQAKKKPVATLGADELGLGAELDAPGLVWEALELPPERAAGRILDGDPAGAAAELARLLHEEAKVI